MPCYFPLTGYRETSTTKTGKRKLTFGSGGYRDLPVTIPCGKCIGCRLERSRQWAVRLTHELQFHELAVFLTLTYNDDRLPEGGSLNRKHFQDFIKRLRFHHEAPYRKARKTPPKIKYYHCGEYGEQLNRPHYHAIIFGLDFADKIKHRKARDGEQIYTSQTLEKLWGHGFCEIGSVTFKSCAYTARYVTKKISGESADAHYTKLNLDTGEIFRIEPEYSTCSQGIGERWLERYASDVFPSDHVVIGGKETGVPRYYRKKLEQHNLKLSKALLYKRIRSAKKRAADNTPERLAVKHECRKAKIQSLKRNL